MTFLRRFMPWRVVYKSLYVISKGCEVYERALPQVRVAENDPGLKNHASMQRHGPQYREWRFYTVT